MVTVRVKAATAAIAPASTAQHLRRTDCPDHQRVRLAVSARTTAALASTPVPRQPVPVPVALHPPPLATALQAAAVM